MLAVAGDEAARVLERAESIVGAEDLVRADMRTGASPWEGFERHGHI